MADTSLQIRWQNDACYEIKLPNGKEILIDPFIENSRYKLLGRESVKAADYILISHTHFDHIMDIPYYRAKFDPLIFAPRISGIALAKKYDIPGGKLNLCLPGDVIKTDDFSIECFRGRHTDMGVKDSPSNWPVSLAEDGIDSDLEELCILGNYEYINYVITFPWNQRFLIWGGGATEDAISKVSLYKPDISIAQMPRETPEQIGRLYAAIGGRYILPHHHEYYTEQGAAGEKAIAETIAVVVKLAPYTTLLFPQKGVWYRFDSGVHEVE